MGLKEIRIPDLGDVEDVDVVEVLISEGDQVAKEAPLISLESEKATMDVPSPDAGTVREIKVKAGDKVKSGDLILLLEAVAESAEPQPEPRPAPEEQPGEEPKEAKEETKEKAEESAARPPAEPPQRRAKAPSSPTLVQGRGAPGERAAPPPGGEPAKVYASPAVRRLARQLGVDLTLVRGTGRKSRILKEDVQGYVKTALASPGGGVGLPPVPVIDFSKFGEVERLELTRIQKVAGPNLQRSWLNAPHVTQHDEADITDLETFRQANKARAKEEGFSLTPLAFVLKAVVAALKEFPRLNASLDPDGEHVVLKKYYHLGVAVDTEDGLIVPVIRDVDKKGVFELAREIGAVSGAARGRKLKPDQLRGGSFTVSSLGGIGGTFFTPIINVPEVAILGVSKAQVRPVWREGEVAPRLILPLSLSYDHRVIDGAMAVRFTTHLAALLGDIRKLVL